MNSIFYSYISKENHHSLLKKYLPYFPRDYQKKLVRFRRWQDTQLSLLGRLLLELGIKSKFPHLYDKNREIYYTSHSKPYFKDKLLEFNISHSGDLVICVLSDTLEIGIDIEQMNDIDIENFRSQMTLHEWDRTMGSQNRKEAFYRYWTQKEAVLKAHGEGLSIPLQSFEINNDETKIKDEVFYVKEIEIDKNYKCYLSYKATDSDRNNFKSEVDFTTKEIKNSISNFDILNG